jgi:plasmid stabilization system protein ParE
VRIEFHPEAFEEMAASARFYEEKAEGLGEDFLEAVRQATRRIRQFPGAGPGESSSLRKQLVAGFPFTIIYARHGDRIFIVAVMHQHRRPGYWKRRVRR